MDRSGRENGPTRRAGDFVTDMRRRITARVFPLAIGILLASGARAAGADRSRVIDPRLEARIASGPDEPLTVWLEFRDKGETDARDLARRTAAAEAALTPRARARRLRAHVAPLVDERDLPVCAAYLDSLEASGLQPFAVSRWFNRAAFRIPARRLNDAAAFGFVSRIAPMERARRDRDPISPREILRSPAGARESAEPFAPRGAAIDDGFTRTQLEQIGIPALHDSGYVGTGVLVCILDDGFNDHDVHQALRNVAIAPGRQRDFVSGDSTVTDPNDPFGHVHGTWVMGCLAGYKPGIYVGAAYGAEFALARTEDDASETPQEMFRWGMGAEWADSIGADIISSSVGYFEFDDPADDYGYAQMNGHTTVVSRAAEIAASKGILVVNSVGNEGDHPWHYLVAPADVNGDSVVAAGAVDAGGNPADFSSWGPSANGSVKPDLVALGVGARVPQVGDSAGYENLSGTSFAAPLVAGLAACIMQARPSWSPQDVIRALRSTASRADRPDDQLGFGIPNGLAAIRWPYRGNGTIGSRIGPLEVRTLGANPMRPDRAPLGIAFTLDAAEPRALEARLSVLDASGRVVRKLWTGVIGPGQHMAAAWDGRDRDGRVMPAGLYWIALRGGKNVAALRVISLR
jgi:hypothetical protein